MELLRLGMVRYGTALGEAWHLFFGHVSGPSLIRIRPEGAA